MNDSSTPSDEPGAWSRDPFFAMMCAEGGLAVAALVLGWLLGHDSLRTMAWTWSAVAWGLAGTVPMFLSMWWISRSQRPVWVALTKAVHDLVVPLFRGRSWLDIAAVSTCAGVGEELFFRGLIQDGISVWLGGARGTWVALAVAGILFGLAHPITRAYALVATAIGTYLGLLWLWTGNLLAPIVAHGVYDFAAILFLLHDSEKKSPVEEDHAAVPDQQEAAEHPRSRP